MGENEWIKDLNERKREIRKEQVKRLRDHELTPRAHAKAYKDSDWERQESLSRQNFFSRIAPRVFKEESKIAEYLEAEIKNKPLSSVELAKYRKVIDSVAIAKSFEPTGTRDSSYRLPQATSLESLGDRNEKQVGALMGDDATFDDYHATTALQQQKLLEQKKIEASGVELTTVARTFVPDKHAVQALLQDEIAFTSDKYNHYSKYQVPRDEPEDTLKILSIDDFRKTLPIYNYRSEILKRLKDEHVLILQGETGCGKSTQIPQYLVETGYTCDSSKRVICTQPRRVAAMSVSARVAYECGVALGSSVGYKVRFDERLAPDTKLIYMTDGMLLREYISDPMLENVSAVVIDEAHERALHTDVLLGFVRETWRVRRNTSNPLTVVIASATLQAIKLSSYFENAAVLHVTGRLFPVAVKFAQIPLLDYVEASAATILQIHEHEPQGDILVFLTGQEEITRCEGIIQEKLSSMQHFLREILIFPVYGALPSDLQRRIFEPTPQGARKVVLATNIAETSLTIDGIVYVIDCGFCKQTWYDSKANMERLLVVPISQAGAEQRRGRAGRTKPGICYRLYTRSSYDNDLALAIIPEVQRTDIAHLVLDVKALGVANFLDFEFIDSPCPENITQAFTDLHFLEALDDDGELTTLGKRMAEFPLDPRLSKSLVRAEKYECSHELTIVVALLATLDTSLFQVGQNSRLRSAFQSTIANFDRGHGDMILFLEIFEQWEDSGRSESWCINHFVQYRILQRACNIRNQLLRLLDRTNILVKSYKEHSDVMKSLIGGYAQNIARLRRYGDTYENVTKPGLELKIHPSSSLAKKRPLPTYVMYHHLRCTKANFMMHCAPILPEWIKDASPVLYYKYGFQRRSEVAS